MAGGVKRWWKKVFEFKPDANKFWVRAGAKVPGSPDEQHAYRYPAPGSRPQASVPNQDDDDLLYDIKYYSRDVRRQPSRISVMSNTPIQAGRTETPLLGSPGNNNPDLNKLGASHLRSAMATNHPDMQAELLKHKQTHLPKFVWENDTSFADMLVSQELPPCPGAPMKWNLPFTPENHPGAKW